MALAIPMTAPVWAIALAVCALLLATPAQAAVFAVNSTVDAVDDLPGDGICADASGACTLRAAVMETNALVGADVVLLPAGTYALGIAGVDEDAAASGDLDITQDLTLVGDGSDTTVIDANGIDRVLHVLGGHSGPHVDLSSVTLTGGSGVRQGGGVLNSGASVALDRSSVSGNQSDYMGGGISSDVGTLSLRNSSVHGNNALFGGGIIHSGRVMCKVSCVCASGWDPGKLVITNSTVSNNSALVEAGGIFLGVPFLLCCGEGLEVTNSTISANLGGALTPACSESAIVSLKNTIVADCSSDYSGLVTSLGHNLDYDGTCNLTDPSDLPNTDPMLGPLQNNGGPTFTHAFLPGSPAIDAIPVADCTYDDDDDPGTPEVPMTEDQRGVVRPEGGGCDIGAYEGTGTVTTCTDGLDNDGDGLIDYPNDRGCTDAADSSERSPTLICDDGIDNDGDTLIDYPDDPGCHNTLWVSENPACMDGIDNDGDGLIDYPDDPACVSAFWFIETSQCQDGLDNDDDGLIDFDGGASAGVRPTWRTHPDPECVGRPGGMNEGCGLGAELVLVLAPLMWLWRRRGRRG